MTVEELIQKFPEIPRSLHQELLLKRFADVFGELLQLARKPSACSTQHDPANHYYLKLIGPLAIHGYGLSTRESVVEQLQDLLDRHAADPQRFASSLLPDDSAEKEIPGPGCS